MKKIILSLLFLLISSNLYTQNIININEKEYTNIEDIVINFIDYLKNQDLPKIYTLTAFNEIYNKYNFINDCSRLMYFNSKISPNPPINDFYKSINCIEYISSISREIRGLTYSLISEIDTSGISITGEDKKIYEKIQNSIHSDQLINIKYIKSGEPLILKYDTSHRLKKIAESFGADDATERSILIELNGKYYYFGIQFLKYGELWKINRFTSIGSILYYARQIDKDDFSKLNP